MCSSDLPDDIVTYDRSGEAIDLGAPKGFLERYIHSEIYRARPDVGAVVHSHSPSVIPFGLVGTGMRSMFHNAAFVGTEVPVFDIRDGFGQTDMLVCDCDRGEALADVLGQANVVLMRAHGSVACGPTLEIAVFRAVYTEVNARIQHWTQALARDGEIAALEPAECELADATNSGAAARAWDLWRRAVRDECGW